MSAARIRTVRDKRTGNTLHLHDFSRASRLRVGDRVVANAAQARDYHGDDFDGFALVTWGRDYKPKASVSFNDTNESDCLPEMVAYAVANLQGSVRDDEH